jgi:glycosyltransferase involved in cell wall biosynthesis
VVVDDGSTDNSRSVIDGYEGRVRAVLQENAGQAAAGWAALQASRGDVVVFLDADDVLDPTSADTLPRRSSEIPALAMVQWRLRTIDETGRPAGGSCRRALAFSRAAISASTSFGCATGTTS